LDQGLSARLRVCDNLSENSQFKPNSRQFSIATSSQQLLFSATRQMPASFPIGTLTLARAKVGERLRVVTICPDCPECVRLRELGFQDRMEVRKITDGSAIICSLMGMRVAIGRDLGDHVRVEKVAA
jgi:Fe2+ transport system protein FeoA